MVKVIFGADFNESIDNLPDSVKHIKLGHNFDKHINRLPLSLKHLEIDNPIYDKLNKQMLPKKLEKLVITGRLYELDQRIRS